jgi:hypothetical protein
MFELSISTAGHSELHTAVRKIATGVVGNLSALFKNLNSAVQIGEGLRCQVLTKSVGGILDTQKSSFMAPRPFDPSATTYLENLNPRHHLCEGLEYRF